MQAHQRIFDSIAQRVAYSYVRSLAAAQQVGADASQRDLHAFFKAFYAALYDSPAQFGLPELEDDCITGAEKERTKKLAELNRKMQRPRDAIDAGLALLMLAGQKGLLAVDPVTGEQMLLLDAGDYLPFLKNAKIKKPFLAGLAGVGLSVSAYGECFALRSARFPAMLPALKALAPACAQAEDPKLGRFNFSRCDFQALDPQFHPTPLDLYRAFPPDDYQRVARLHEYFLRMGYKPVFQIYGNFGWEVQYQGKRQVKSTPFFGVQYSERFQNPLRVQVKCASSNRLVPLLAGQPRALQADFFQRAYTCNGDACGWCKNRKNLGPSEIEFEGVRKTICWYSNPDIADLNDDAVTMIQQYAVMHEGLG
jgi:hypothetical protein